MAVQVMGEMWAQRNYFLAIKLRRQNIVVVRKAFEPLDIYYPGILQIT